MSWTIFIIPVFVLLFVLGFGAYILINEDLISLDSNYSELEQKSKDYINKVYLTYDYELAKDVNRSEEEILENGGDCYDYSRLYSLWAERDGLNHTFVRLKIDNDRGHRMGIISNEEGYCVLDQLKYWCYEYKK